MGPAASPSSATARRTRPVDRLVIHGAPLEFRALCERAVPEDTRFLVLDLDRTVHLGRNMGELLGWEIIAARAYGAERLAAAESRRPPGRFFLDRARPLALVRYLALGLSTWALPGLFYLLFGKIPSLLAPLRRWMFRAFGPEPVAAVQRVPQTTLLRHLWDVPAAELRVLAERVWDRHAGDQVIEREDLEWLRRRCPGIRIVLASASPRPTLEVARERLGADDAIWSTLHRINSSRVKIENLWARYPELADPRTPSVGMTDTGYGEDHCWLDHFTRVVDVNSTSPFPPFVNAGSPLREIHSAAVLTRAERERRARGDARALDARRAWRDEADRVYTADELSARLAATADAVETLARMREAREALLAAARTRVQERVLAITGRIEAIVRAVEGAAASERAGILARLRAELRENRAVQRELARIERPIADVACALTSALASSRAKLERRERAVRRAPAAPRTPRSSETVHPGMNEPRARGRE